jgi:hypothetical protein
MKKNNVTLLSRQDIDLCGGEWIVGSGAAEGCILWPTDQKSVALSRCAAVFPAFGLPFLLPLALSQAGIDSTLARIRIVLGCPHLCRLVAPARRLLAASLFVCPWHPEEPPQAPRTRSDDPRHAVAAAGAPDPGSLERRPPAASVGVRENPRCPHRALSKLSQHFRGRGSPYGLQDALSPPRPSCSSCYQPRLRHGRKTRYGWAASPYPAGTLTLPETPSLSWRDNARD